jgi:hypothetical protein
MFSLRLFGDFKYDACLIITQPQLFIDQLAHSVLRQLPRWNARARPVSYIDPVRAKPAAADLYWTKDFSYAYPYEYRLVWLPPFPLFTLRPIDVELGSLRASCHLISL